MKIGAIILAAGSSSRLGEPKQLLEFEGKTLLRRAVETAVDSNCTPVIVVLGSNAEKILDENNGFRSWINSGKFVNANASAVICENWADGMGASITFGVTRLLAIAPDLSAVLILLCDQPFVTTATIERLIKARKQTKKSIAVCEYAKTIGVPALFAREMFDELLNLTDKAGAKNLFGNHWDKLTKISAPEAIFDIDTNEDYEKLQTISRNS